jgi:hypothetical protein
LKRADRGDCPARTVEDGFLGEDRYRSFRRLVSSARPLDREPDALLCRHLTARVWTVRHPALPVAPALYGCQRTLRPEGPDGSPALPDDCTDERDCFDPADRLGDSES